MHSYSIKMIFVIKVSLNSLTFYEATIHNFDGAFAA